MHQRSQRRDKDVPGIYQARYKPFSRDFSPEGPQSGNPRNELLTELKHLKKPTSEYYSAESTRTGSSVPLAYPS